MFPQLLHSLAITSTLLISILAAPHPQPVVGPNIYSATCTPRSKTPIPIAQMSEPSNNALRDECREAKNNLKDDLNFEKPIEWKPHSNAVPVSKAGECSITIATPDDPAEKASRKEILVAVDKILKECDRPIYSGGEAPLPDRVGWMVVLRVEWE